MKSAIKWSFKANNSFDQRKTEGTNIRKKFPDRIPVSFVVFTEVVYIKTLLPTASSIVSLPTKQFMYSTVVTVNVISKVCVGNKK